MSFFKRSDENPILVPKLENAWEAEAVFNGCPVKKDNSVYMVYRALSAPHFHAQAGRDMRVSSIGCAVGPDGIHFKKRYQLVRAEEDWERFGCEDPRVTKLDGKYYIFYTALSSFPPTPDGIKIAVAVTRDLRRVTEKHLVTTFNSKAMALFPERIDGKMAAILTVHTDMPPAKICLALFDSEEEIWSSAYWERWYASLDSHVITLQRSADDHIEVGTPPVKTPQGWLLAYSYIRNYFSPQRVFGIEAALLDLKNPQQVIGRTSSPLLVPEEEYEKYGQIPNIVFPSGLRLERGKVWLYYGAADTTCCVATARLDALLPHVARRKRSAVSFARAKENPILAPLPDHAWESKLVFNPAALYANGKVHLIYRAMSADNTSVFGYASSKDGIHIDTRLPEPVYAPRESFEQKLQPGNSGCEDPRLTKIGDRVYMCYTAFDGKNPPRVALSSILYKDFINKRWRWKSPVLLSPPGYDDKDACIFPQKVNGKYLILHRIGNTIDLSWSKTLDFDGKTWLEERKWLTPRFDSWDSEKVGIAAPPIKTKHGWVLLYHGVSKEDRTYRVGAALLDLKDPTRILARTGEPLLEPETPYEKEGMIRNVVFPCGAVLKQNNIFLYYGGADTVVGVATIKIENLMKAFRNS